MSQSTQEQVAIKKFAQRGLLAVILFVLILVGAYIFNNDSLLIKRVGDYSELGGNFTLQAKQGAVSLSDYRGKVVVLYFGFLNCPDVCPTSMSVISRSINKLPAVEQEQVQAILISIDPQRDNVDALDKFTQHFHKNMIGLTGSTQDIETVAEQYGAYFDVIESADDDYLFEHVSRYYVIDQNGVLVDALRHGSSANEIAARVQLLLK